MAVTAEEIMDEPDFIDFEADVGDVFDELMGVENTLIVRKNGEVVGEIHENSLLKALIPEEELDEESVIGVLGLSYDQGYTPEIAEDLMNEHEVTVTPEAEIGQIALLMFREDIRAVPVMEGEEVVGVVHEDSVVEAGEV
jgi:predicted transcriptional regulator